MGAVYRAMDSRLNREVAIKVLPDSLLADAESLARLEREARTLARLNHPGIVSVFSMETVEGTDEIKRSFLVMELVEGRALSDEIHPGGMPLDRFLRLALQIAETLAAAHAEGVIHRDLKPGNIMVTPSDSIKILDFGLAKLLATFSGDSDTAPTQTLVQLTGRDQILGTIPYMSPEQARSQPLDERSDLFSLGVVLFEMLSGERPFRGDTAVDVISSILSKKPHDLGDLRPEIPESLRRVVDQCLRKRPQVRPSSALELKERLAGVAEDVLGATMSRSDETTSATTKDDLDPRAVAVLPFANLSGTEEASLLAIGLHNDLLTELSRISGLTVISRTSVMAYRDTSKPISQIGRELRVGTLIEGTVQTAGNRVRLTAQLIDARSDVQRWAERYDRELSTDTLFDLQTDVSRRIIDSLQSAFAPALEVPSGKPGTHDLKAYRLWTLGRVQIERRTEDGCQRAVEHFQEAVDQDPTYAAAWAGLSEALSISVWYGYAEPGDLLQRAGQAARRAVALDPKSAESHGALATYYGAIRNGPKAMEELELAVQLQPSFWDAHNRLSYLHNLHGRAGVALESAKRAVELNPLSAEAVSNLSLSLFFTGDPKGAIREARHAAELSPGWTTADFYQALPLYELGRYDEAEALLTGLDVEWAGQGAQATLAATYVANNEEASARKVLEGMDPKVDAFAVGLVHLALREVDRAFERFFESEVLNDWACLAIHHFYDDLWAPVRDDPRYATLVRRAYENHQIEPSLKGVHT